MLAQSLLGEMSMKAANNHCECRACWEMVSKKRASNVATMAQSLLGEMSVKKANIHCECRACWEMV